VCFASRGTFEEANPTNGEVITTPPSAGKEARRTTDVRSSGGANALPTTSGAMFGFGWVMAPEDGSARSLDRHNYRYSGDIAIVRELGKEMVTT
jgi:hypothetical protein